MQVFVGAVIAERNTEDDQGDVPSTEPSERQSGEGGDHSNRRSVPPRHRNRPFVFFLPQMVTLIGFEKRVMRLRVSFKGVLPP